MSLFLLAVGVGVLGLAGAQWFYVGHDELSVDIQPSTFQLHGSGREENVTILLHNPTSRPILVAGVTPC
jgi:hypothetical protein